MRLRPSLAAVAVLFTALVGSIGCAESTDPGVEPEIVNQTDSFEFQITGVRNYSRTLQYTWRNTGTQADVNQATTLTAGTALLEIHDAEGAQVYSSNLDANGTFQTDTGASGDWTIRVLVVGASGTLNFRVEKRS